MVDKASFRAELLNIIREASVLEQQADRYNIGIEKRAFVKAHKTFLAYLEGLEEFENSTEESDFLSRIAKYTAPKERLVRKIMEVIRDILDRHEGVLAGLEKRAKDTTSKSSNYQKDLNRYIQDSLRDSNDTIGENLAGLNKNFNALVSRIDKDFAMMVGRYEVDIYNLGEELRTKLDEQRGEFSNRELVEQDLSGYYTKDEVTELFSAIKFEEFRSMLFDSDGYFTGKIRPLSVETTSISVGADSTDFSLSVRFQPNYLSNPNIVQWSGGELTHFKFNNSGTFKWEISAGSHTNLVEYTPYYIYARCSKEGYHGEIVLDTKAWMVDESPGYYYFKIGTLSSVILGMRGITLSYGRSEINGREITTGKITSRDGRTSFDLDTGEIVGKIKFLSPGGDVRDVADIPAISQDYADSVANAAKTAAINSAAADATTKDSALKSTVQSYADSAALSQANVAKAAAILAASADAQSKADAARLLAEQMARGLVDGVEGAIAEAERKAVAAQNAYNTLTGQLKKMAYKDVVALADLGATVIEGGKLTNTLIDTNYVRSNIINAGYINTLSLTSVQGKIGGWTIANNRLLAGTGAAMTLSAEAFPYLSLSAAGRTTRIDHQGLATQYAAVNHLVVGTQTNTEDNSASALFLSVDHIYSRIGWTDTGHGEYRGRLGLYGADGNVFYQRTNNGPILSVLALRAQSQGGVIGYIDASEYRLNGVPISMGGGGGGVDPQGKFLSIVTDTTSQAGTYSGDINSAYTSIVYAQGATNSPANGHLLTMRVNNLYASQLHGGVNANNQWSVRTLTNGSWSDWRTVWTSGNLRSNADNDVRYAFITGDTFTNTVNIRKGSNNAVYTSGALNTFHFGNTGVISSLLWGEYYGTLIGIKSRAANYYAFSVGVGMSEAGTGDTRIFSVYGDGRSIFTGTTILNPTSFTSNLPAYSAYVTKHAASSDNNVYFGMRDAAGESLAISTYAYNGDYQMRLARGGLEVLIGAISAPTMRTTTLIIDRSATSANSNVFRLIGHGLTTTMGSLNTNFFHMNTTAPSGFYMYQGLSASIITARTRCIIPVGGKPAGAAAGDIWIA